MRIPLKITPDGLTDAVVLVRYASASVPPQAVFGGIYQVLVEQGFNYLPAPQEGELAAGAEIFFNENGVVVSSSPGQLWFNGVTVVDEPAAEAGSYIGWAAYQRVLAAVLEPLLNREIIRKLLSVSVRYVNILPWQPPAEQVNFALAVPPAIDAALMPTIDYRVSWPANSQGYRVRLRITDQLKRRDSQNTGRGTLFDVEIGRRPDGNDFEALQHTIELAHQKQKEVFFGLLSPAFLASLHPEYAA